MVGSSEDVRSLAAQVRRDADHVRLVASRVAATRGIAWRSVAASRFRDVVTERVVGLGRAVGRLEAAAEAVDAHAIAVHRAQEALRSVAEGLPGAGRRR